VPGAGWWVSAYGGVMAQAALLSVSYPTLGPSLHGDSEKCGPLLALPPFSSITLLRHASRHLHAGVTSPRRHTRRRRPHTCIRAALELPWRRPSFTR
jgi:hypothetical protein